MEIDTHMEAYRTIGKIEAYVSYEGLLDCKKIDLIKEALNELYTERGWNKI